jgi:hypothetical protein
MMIAVRASDQEIELFDGFGMRIRPSLNSVILSSTSMFVAAPWNLRQAFDTLMRTRSGGARPSRGGG